MHGIDWTRYELQPAPRTLLCQFRRKDGFAHTGFAKDFLPEFNIAGLEWKLTGIAREEWERMPDAVKQQVMPQAGMWSQMNMMRGLSSMGQSSMVQRDAAFGEYTPESASVLFGL